MWDRCPGDHETLHVYKRDTHASSLDYLHIPKIRGHDELPLYWRETRKSQAVHHSSAY